MNLMFAMKPSAVGANKALKWPPKPGFPAGKS